ncbi:FAD-dependent oxidoreductase [Pontibacter sp. G13]|uniref:NAD(P)/FAD-dependent oxidoreductase n=1 Tax=Pontibacter sp. G13 TaxID=3074898 RepID=UPI00288B26EC|nr:FAD-dependent oxidoreductase [Pontibacter sp. G13]WNJ19281.1 FAD-dependent oxidoreductase [Pontibacter sp. G13]
MHLSYWESDSFFSHIDCAIIGSGIVGLNAAIELKRLHPNWRIVVLERGAIPSGASTKNAGFACFGSMTELMADLTSHSEQELMDLIQLRWKGLQFMRETLGDAPLKFDPCGGFELFRPQEESVFEACMDSISYFNQLVQSATGLADTFSLTDDQIEYWGFQGISHAIFNQHEGAIHTGEMMKGWLGLAQSIGIEIFTGITIEAIHHSNQQVELLTNAGFPLHAERVLVATNGFAKRLLPELPVLPARNQVLVTEPIPKLTVRGTFHYHEGYVYVRNIGNRLLIGGGRHLAQASETTDQFGLTDQIRTYLTDILAQTLLPNQPFQIAHAWSGIMGIGTQKRPIVQQTDDRIWVAVRLGGMGVAIGSQIGREAAQLLSS